jgi:hypothetical protein
VAGAQELTLGSSGSVRDFLLPSFSIVTQAGTNPFTSGSTPHPDPLSSSFLAGRLGLNEVSGRSQLLLDYVAGASFSNDPTLGNSLIQGLDVSETIRSGRSSVLFADHFSYLSSSPFGFGGLGGLKNLGVGLGNGVGSSPGISSSFAPSDSIYLSGLPRANNAALGQVTYELSHRSSVNVVASYGILDYLNSPLENANVYSFQGGYGYLLSRLNSISVFYRFDDFSFSNLPHTAGIHDHRAQAAFARRITGRLSWQIGGGPSIQHYQNPRSGSATVIGPNVFTGLAYRLRYTGFGFSYSHGLTNGSGVLPGALTDSLSGRVTRTFGKNWDSAIEGGYSRNEALLQTSSATGSTNPSTWFTTARISRLFVGYGAFSVAYSAAGQSSLSSICTLPSCKISSLTQTVSLGYTWALRPVHLE